MMNPVAAPLQENVASALCYALGLITGIVFLVLQPYNQNRAIRFHAFQSIFGNVVLIAADIVLGILFPWGYAGFLATIGYLIWRVFELGCIGVWLYMIISTYQGKKIVLPGVGPLAEKQA